MEQKSKITFEELHSKSMEQINTFFDLNDNDIENVDKQTFFFKIQKARIGFQVFREVNIEKRAKENNIIRIYKEISMDKKEFARFIKKALPKYYPVSKK